MDSLAYSLIENILNFYKRNPAENDMLGQIGGPLFQHKYWSFIDWTTQWNDTFGMCSAGLEGPVTMESLLYLLGLQKAAGLADYLGMTCYCGKSSICPVLRGDESLSVSGVKDMRLV